MLELAWPYLPVAVLALFWALAMRPVLRLIHASAFGPRRRTSR